ncbi:MAG: hypothetical protein FJX65_17810 [Alphaproteobacteria bacterium]|nr:hypothetical protein [Alphaproteobacteria bacterium]
MAGLPHAALRRVALYARPESRFLMLALAKRLREAWGSTVHLYCANADQVASFRRAPEAALFERIEAVGVFSAFSDVDHHTPLSVAEQARAEAIERDYGVTLNFLAVSNRHIGRGYALGGPYHPRSRLSDRATDRTIARGYARIFDYWEGEFDRHGFTLLLNGGRESVMVARRRNIPSRILIGSRFKNLHCWAWNEFYECPEVEHAYRTLPQRVGAQISAPYQGHLDSRRRARRAGSAGALLKRAILMTARYAWWWIRGYEKGRTYYLSSNLKFLYRIWRDWRDVRRLARTRVGDLTAAGVPFVYYPCHLEPEAALQGISPEFFFQHALIAAVSRDLPAGVMLAVKEAFGAIGRRPIDFYRHLADLKNVVLLDPWEMGLDCVRASRAVVTICGSTGFEAAAMGRQVIALGRHNVFSFLPVVQTAKRLDELGPALQRALSSSEPTAESEAQGRRFLAAVEATSFDLRGFDYGHPSIVDPEAVDAMAEGLLRSVSMTPVPLGS